MIKHEGIIRYKVVGHTEQHPRGGYVDYEVYLTLEREIEEMKNIIIDVIGDLQYDQSEVAKPIEKLTKIIK